jgi:hypothetical protein
MFNIISKNNFKMNNNENANNENRNNENGNKMEIEYTLTDLLPKPDTDMKNELKKFLKKQMNPTDDISNTTSISALDSMMSNSYSDFSS